MKTKRRLGVLERSRAGVSLADDDTFQPERVRNISIGMMFHHEFERATHGIKLLSSTDSLCLSVHRSVNAPEHVLRCCAVRLVRGFAFVYP